VPIELAIRPVALVPPTPSATHLARGLLPSQVPHPDATRTAARAALLMAALAGAPGGASALLAATEDRLHQPYRGGLVPGLDEIVRVRAPGLLGCVLSGAGPSILVFYEKGFEPVCDLIRQIFQMHGHQAEVLWPQITDHGYELTTVTA
jgi:homoserine kinase